MIPNFGSSSHRSRRSDVQKSHEQTYDLISTDRRLREHQAEKRSSTPALHSSPGSASLPSWSALAVPGVRTPPPSLGASPDGHAPNAPPVPNPTLPLPHPRYHLPWCSSARTAASPSSSTQMATPTRGLDGSSTPWPSIELSGHCCHNQVDMPSQMDTMWTHLLAPASPRATASRR